jgi:hypothetical protein
MRAAGSGGHSFHVDNAKYQLALRTSGWSNRRRGVIARIDKTGIRDDEVNARIDKAGIRAWNGARTRPSIEPSAISSPICF